MQTALFWAIADDPGSDAARLAFADACEREDPARAEFIRLQCALAGLPAGPRRDAGYERLNELFKAHARRWLGPLATIVGASFSRGFPDGAGGTAADLLVHADALLTVAPTLRLRLEDLTVNDPALARLLDHPLMERVEQIDVSESDDDLDERGVRLLLTASRLRRLRAFSLFDADCNPQTVRAVAEHLPTTVTSLSFVGFMSTTVNDDAIAVLAGSPRLAQLAHLTLYNCNLRGAGASHLATSPYLTGLKTLRLGLGQYTLNQIGADGAAALAEATFAPGLAHLDLDFNDIGDAGLRALTDGRLAAIRILRLQRNLLSDGPVTELLRSPLAQRLEVLDLWHNDLGTPTGRTLAETTPENLRTLWINLDREGTLALLRAPWLGQLDELNVTGNGLRDADVEAWLGCPALRSIGRVAAPRFGPDQSRRLAQWLGPAHWRPHVTSLRPVNS